MIRSVNPYTNQLIREFKLMDRKTLDQVLQRSSETFLDWKDTDWDVRSKLMNKVAGILEERKTEFGRLITEEMGKPVAESMAEVEKCAWVCKYYALKAEEFLSDEIIESDAGKSFVAYQPLGPVLAVMPWNFPFWQVFRFAAPALMAGNTGILKHASNVSLCALAIEKIFADAGFPEGAFQVVLVNASEVAYIIDHPAVKAATLTGSEKAGMEVAKTAGKNIKKTVLELGGSDPFIVLNDADVELAAETGIKSRFINSGQSCIAAKRFIVEEDIYDRFSDSLCKAVAYLRTGDPMDPKTQIGPLARKDLVDSLEKQVQDSVRAGAKVLAGGKTVKSEGNFFEPTVLEELRPGMPAYEEELFGPVLSLFRAASVEEAIRIANDSRYGLGASVWTRDERKGEEIARKIEAGCVFVNGMVKSDPRLPFGGIKMSGYGRELSYHGIREFTNTKAIWVK